jgi:hypothetical protein
MFTSHLPALVVGLSKTVFICNGQNLIFWSGYWAVTPPSITSSDPVTNEASIRGEWNQKSPLLIQEFLHRVI